MTLQIVCYSGYIRQQQTRLLTSCSPADHDASCQECIVLHVAHCTASPVLASNLKYLLTSTSSARQSCLLPCRSKWSTVDRDLSVLASHLNTQPVTDAILLEIPGPLADKTRFCFGFRGNKFVLHSQDETLTYT